MYKQVSDNSQLPEDEYLSADEVMDLHNRLVKQANELVESTLKAMNELTQHQELDPDSLDIAVSESNRELSLRFANRERRLLGKIRYAIKRVYEGEYGSCISCGVPIGYRRLMVRPVATMCIDCKTEQEQLER